MFEAIDCVMIESSTYDDAYIRPYQTHYDGYTEENLHNATGGTDFSRSALSGVASSILQPSTEVQGRASIANGFSEKRFYFVMRLRSNRSYGDESIGASISTNYIVTGYSDYLGVSLVNQRNNIDPNIRMYINNIITLRSSEVPGRSTMRRTYNIGSCDQLLSNGGNEDSHMRSPETRYSIRPEDVMGEASIMFDPTMQGQVINESSRIRRSKLSNRRDNVRSQYLSDTLSSYNRAYNDVNLNEYVEDNSSVYKTAKSMLAGKSHNNAFVRMLFNNTDHTHNNYVTYREICHAIPNLDQVTQFSLMGRHDQHNAYVRGMGEAWRGSQMETIAVSIAQATIPSLMIDSLILRINVTATNDTVDGQHNCFTERNPGMLDSSISDVRYIENFLARLELEVLQDISKNNEISYHLRFDIDLFRESRYWISIDGDPEVMYVIPNFCDNLYAPLISGVGDERIRMATDLDTIVTSLHEREESPSSVSSSILDKYSV